MGGYFCVLLISLPRAYPTAKHVQPKLIIAITPRIMSIGGTRVDSITPYEFDVKNICLPATFDVRKLDVLSNVF